MMKTKILIFLVLIRNSLVVMTTLFASALILIATLSWFFYGSGCDIKSWSGFYLAKDIIIDYENEDCDVIAHYEIQSIFARSPQSRKRQLVFRFEPANSDLFPNIFLQNDGSISIEINKVSTVIYKLTLFRRKGIHYKIDQEFNPL